MSGEVIGTDRLQAVRDAVAGVMEARGRRRIAKGIRMGRLDDEPIVACAIAAVEHVLKGQVE